MILPYLERWCVLSCLVHYLIGRSRIIYQQSKSQYVQDCQNLKTGFLETTLETCRLLKSPEFTLKSYSQALFSAYNPPPKSNLIALIELYHLKLSNIIWERQDVEFCISYKKLRRLTSTRPQFYREKKPEHHHQQQKSPNAIWDNMSCAYSTNNGPQDLGSWQSFLSALSEYSFSFWSGIRSLLRCQTGYD